MIRPLFTLLMLVSAVFMLCIIAAQIVGTTQAPSPLLAFTSDRDNPNNYGDVMLMDMTRNMLINITPHLREMGTVNGQMMWSRGGDLAFAILTPDNDLEIYVWSNGRLTNVSQNSQMDFNPVWSEDGRLAFISYRDNGLTICVWDNGQLIILGLPVTQNRRPAWSRDGRLAIAVSRTSGTGIRTTLHTDVHIWDGSTSIQIDSVDDLGQFAWGVDGRLAYDAVHDGNWDVFIWDGSTPQNISTNPAADHSPAWSPDGRLSFMTNRNGSLDVYVWDEGTITRIAQDPQNERNGSWSADGRLAFSSIRTGDNEIYIWDGSTVVNISQNSADDQNIMWSPNGWLSFNSNRDRYYKISLWDGNTLTSVAQSSANDPVQASWFPSS